MAQREAVRQSRSSLAAEPGESREAPGTGLSIWLNQAAPTEEGIQTSNEIALPTEPVDVNVWKTAGTNTNLVIAMVLLLILGPIILLIGILLSNGLALPLYRGAFLFRNRRRRKARAHLRGSGVRVGPSQFPEIHAAATQMAARLGLDKCPDIYIVEDNSQNALALKHGKDAFVVLIDDFVHAAISTRNLKALYFVIGHELAHHAYGHTGGIRSMARQLWLRLSRLDESSCDAVARELIGDLAAARAAMKLLLIGPQLFSRINTATLDEQVQDVMQDKFTRRSEDKLTHPLTLNRCARLAIRTPA